MSDDSKIEWTNATWNPIRGCSRVSEGCRHCYAESVAARFSGPGLPYEGLVRIASGKPTGWNGVVRMVHEHLADPLRWKRPRRVFVNSMSDLFHESLTNEQIAAVFGVMAAAPRHTFQVLTKRSARMREWFAWVADHGARGARSACRASAALYLVASPEVPGGDEWPLRNVWLGVSTENQAAADERIPELLRTPAAVRWISAEPLIGPVDLRAWTSREHGLSLIGAVALGNLGAGLAFIRESGELSFDVRFVQGLRNVDIGSLKNRNLQFGISYMYYLGQ